MPRNSKFDNEEEWFLFRDGKYHFYYVSNKGRVKYKYKKSKIERIATVSLNNGKATIRVNRNHIQLKNLVAKICMSREYNKVKNPVVINIDGNPLNCDVSNLKIISQKEHRNTYTQKNYKKCFLYENGVKVKTFNSIRQASKELFYGASSISNHFKHGRPAVLPFDLRLED